MTKISPLVKGLITGVLMVALILIFSYMKIPATTGAQYLIYAVFGGGIIWTLLDFSRTEAFTGKFGELFNQGFRCFVVVTLILVIFIAAFTLTHPEMKEEAANYRREELQKQKNMLPADIEKQVEELKSSFTTRFVSTSIFQGLVLGSIFTAAGAGLILIRRR